MEKPLEEAQIEIPPKSSALDVPVSSDDITRLISPPIETEATPQASVQETRTEPITDELKSDQQRQTSHYAHGQSLSHLLPPHSFAQISPRCYLFAGAEVTHENMDDDGNSDNSSDSDESNDEFSDEEEMTEEPKMTANEITVPDIDNVMPPALSCEIPVPEISPTPSTSSLVSSPSRSQLECGDRETVETIDANIQEDHDDLQPAPKKKPRLDIEESIFS